MKRLLPALSVLVVVFAACGVSQKSPSVPTTVSPQLTTAVVPVRTVRVIATERRREAGRQAARLLHRFVLPSGARPTLPPPGVDLLRRSGLGVSVSVKYAERYGLWRVREPLGSVVAFVRRHPPSGLAWGGSGGSPSSPVFRSLDYYDRPAGGRPPHRLLTVTLVPLHGWTVFRVDAGAAWVYPRSPREDVPAGVRKIDIRSGHIARQVTDTRQITRIIRWFNALNIVQPGTPAVGCALILASRVTFEFRSASGKRLAKAVVPLQPATWCDQIEFSIRGHRQMPLIDSTPLGGRAFIDRVQRLLGVRFGPRH